MESRNGADTRVGAAQEREVPSEVSEAGEVVGKREEVAVKEYIGDAPRPNCDRCGEEAKNPRDYPVSGGKIGGVSGLYCVRCKANDKQLRDKEDRTLIDEIQRLSSDAKLTTQERKLEILDEIKAFEVAKRLASGMDEASNKRWERRIGERKETLKRRFKSLTGREWDVMCVEIKQSKGKKP